MNFRSLRVAWMAAAVLAMPGAAQTKSSILLHGKEYAIAEMPGGTMHLVQLAGPEWTATVTVNNDRITAYNNPVGGGAFRALIDQVWDTYLRQKSWAAAKGSAVNNVPAMGAAPLPSAAANSGAARTGSVQFLPGGGAIVHGTRFGDITLNEDATQGSATQQGNSRVVGPVSRTLIYELAHKKGGIEVYQVASRGRKELLYGTREGAAKSRGEGPLEQGKRDVARAFLDSARDALQAARAAAEQGGSAFHADESVVAEFENYAAGPRQ